MSATNSAPEHPTTKDTESSTGDATAAAATTAATVMVKTESGKKLTTDLPKVILRNKRGRYIFLDNIEQIEKHEYAWYILSPTLVTLEQLATEMKVPGRCWFATDRTSYAMVLESGCARGGKEVTGNGEGKPHDSTSASATAAATAASTTTTTAPPSSLPTYVCLIAKQYTQHVMYWFGLRVEKPVIEDRRIVILSIAEMYLKSLVHQHRFMNQLVQNIRRVLSNDQVGPCGNALIEIRRQEPSPAELGVLSILPGVAKLYHALPAIVDEAGRPMHGGDPRGEVICDGAGGMPIMREQSVMCLLSGGIDSPVAAYKMMVRGCHVHGVHFLNSTNDTATVMDKNRSIAKRLSQVQGHFVMRYVDIQQIQTQIVAKVPNHNRTLVYKHFMLALASTLASTDHANAKLLVVGDSLGQVASQTLDNISTLYRSVDVPVVAPLLGSNKTEIIDVAKRIKTFDFSIIAAEDCCQYMMCKVGANLFIGTKVLRGCARAIEVESLVLPVRAEYFFNGEFVKAVDEELVPIRPKFHLQKPIRAAVAARNESEQERVDRVNARLERLSRNLKTSSAYTAAAHGALPSSSNSESQAQQHQPHAQTHQNEAGEEEEDEDDDGPWASRTIYFDCAAGTKLRPQVQKAMICAPEANPNTLHHSGRAARMAIELVRSEFAAMLGVAASDIIFTSGGTEANNIALHGFKVVHREAWTHASTSGEEKVADGANDTRPTIAVIDLVNHETGSINAVLKRPVGASRLHVDACQALLKVNFKGLDLKEVDSMSFTAHKINGPVGCGILFIRNLAALLKSGVLSPMMYGGTQEHGLRPGTENTAAIVGFGKALRLDRSSSVHHEIDDLVVASLTDMNCVVNRRGKTSGFICHATLPEGIHHVDVVTMMSTVHHVEIGTGAACKTGHANYGVYETLGVVPYPENRSIRISWDSFSTMAQAQRVISALQTTLKELQRRGRK